MLGWTGLAILPETQLGWQGDIENVAGTAARDLVDVETFGWSPDGRRLAYMDASGPGDPVLRIATDPLGTDPSTIPGVSGTSIVWSPTGDRVLLSSRADDAISVVDRNGVVTTLDPQGHDAAWSSTASGWRGRARTVSTSPRPTAREPRCSRRRRRTACCGDRPLTSSSCWHRAFLIADADTLASHHSRWTRPISPAASRGLRPATASRGRRRPTARRHRASGSTRSTVPVRSRCRPCCPCPRTRRPSQQAPFWSPDEQPDRGRRVERGRAAPRSPAGPPIASSDVDPTASTSNGARSAIVKTFVVPIPPLTRWTQSPETRSEWWPVVGVIGAGGACVLATDQDAPLPVATGVPPAATHPHSPDDASARLRPTVSGS